MYNLQSHGRLVKIDQGTHDLLAVLSEDCSVAEAFALVNIEEALLGSREEITRGDSTFTAGTWSYVFLPPGVDWDELEIGKSFYMYDDDNSADIACFVGEDDGWYDSSTVVWEDGGSRPFWPCD